MNFKLMLSSLLMFKMLLATENCFIAKEGDQIIHQEGDVSKRYAPCSTFKIFLSLIGYDACILRDEVTPVWSFEEGYPSYFETWKQDQTPASWMKYSCVWYSQKLTKALGMEKFKAYVEKLNYGNKDLSGDKGKDNGLTNAWLSSSLEISPDEQLHFLSLLVSNKLCLSQHAMDTTKKILFMEELDDGWKLYGKTGSGNILSEDRTQKTDIQHGWFIGWIEKNGTVIIFVNHLKDSEKVDVKRLEDYAAPRAKAVAKKRLLGIINAKKECK
jgi:beta-lactamase class D